MVNPAARTGARSDAAATAADRLREHGHHVTVSSGGSAADTSQLIREAVDRGVDGVVVVGGDGTVSLAAQVLHGTEVPLGIVPAGTGNDFALCLGIPQLEPKVAADVIATGSVRRVDLARVQAGDGASRVYTTVLASGFDSKVNDRANRMRWPRGDMRYNLAVLAEFLFLAPIPYVIEVDDRRIDGGAVMVSVGNTRSYGGDIPVCPDADPADGLLDVTVVLPHGRLHLLRLLPTVYRGTHVARPEVRTYRGRRIRLHAPGVTAYADGDPLGALPVSIEVLPGALAVFAPAPA